MPESIVIELANMSEDLGVKQRRKCVPEWPLRIVVARTKTEKS